MTQHMAHTYRVNSIFYSLQGEGANTGRAALFVRFAGCNLRCSFCDTEFETFTTYSAEDIVARLLGYCKDCILTEAKPMVVLTGGEPTLQADEYLVDMLHGEGFYVAMESNGTRPAPPNLDWLTVSPKYVEPSSYDAADEIKVVFTMEMAKDDTGLLEKLGGLHGQSAAVCGDSFAVGRTQHRPLLFLQPCDTGDNTLNGVIVKACVEYIKQHPQWRLSLQTHKLIGIE